MDRRKAASEQLRATADHLRLLGRCAERFEGEDKQPYEQLAEEVARLRAGMNRHWAERPSQ